MKRVSKLLLFHAGAASIAMAIALMAIPASVSGATKPASYECRGAHPIYLNASYSFAERAADLVSCMTLSQEVLQLHTNSAPAIPRLHMQQYWYWNEGQHGVNTMNADTNNGNTPGGVHATSFPTNFASTMTWDPGLVYKETTAVSDEARGFLDPALWGKAQNDLGPSAQDYGDLTYWAPTVNMDRDPRWGRTDEAFGEDPYLVSRMAGAFVDGYQGETLSGKPLTKYLKVAATAKHYALNDVENDRQADDSVTNDANIRDYYTAQFRSLFENAHVSGFMTSYNAVNGTPASADAYTANELAQRTYGQNGYTTSDCGAVGTTYQNPPSGHDWAPPGWATNGGGSSAVWTNRHSGKQVSGAAGGQAFAVRAGTDLNCTGAEYTPQNIQQDIKAGMLSKGVIDNALTHVLTTRMETGEFDPRKDVPWTKIKSNVIQSKAHQALARKVADNSLVLLKNDSVAGTSSPLLPADPSKLNNVVVVGNLANTTTLGDYSGDPSLQVSPVTGITQAIKAANPSANIYYDSCGTSTTATAPASCSAQTLSEIQNADLVVVFVGTDLNVATEGHDRGSIAMPGNYDSLINQVAGQGNPRMLLAIQSNGPVTISNVQKDFPAILFSGYNGESQGTALADVMFGEHNPSGHLDFTWFKNDSQLPPMEDYGLTPGQTGGLGRTYMYFTGKPTYPFGYGLSYSSFRYSGIHVSPTSTTPNGTVTVSFNVTNSGNFAGATVGQLYVTPPSDPALETPTEQLAGFKRTNVLNPGQTQHVTLSVEMSSLSRWDESLLKQVVINGPYEFKVGADSAHLQASPRVSVAGTLSPRVQYVTVQPDQVIFRPGQTLELTGKNPWIKPDTDPSLEQRHAPADNIVEAVDNNQSFVNLAHAKVSYSTTNPRVATVSPSGKLRAVSVGVTAINVTVDGVTGSTPIVVKQPLKVMGGDARTHTATTRSSSTTTSSKTRSAGRRSGRTNSATRSHAAAERPKVAVTVQSRSAVHGRFSAGPARAASAATTASNDSSQRIVGPGSTFTTSATLRDPRGAAPLRDVRLRLVAPGHWLVEPTSPTRFARVNPGHSVHTTWHVTVPSGAKGGVKTLTVVANFRSASGPADATAQTQVSVPYASLAAAFNNPGITDDSDTTPGNVDGGGQS
ncbi:MAG TPA: glycoside hydrolase family 3 C-terminal domain-containing protein, partial [Solirubrobacteraceae bacterium]